ncbi:dihydroxy-acid dehydratase [Babesia caballi]|uniref:Dihydroxy-acid dehydratase n=1 Tax=Babesia caballi TaxID=5871 RepID=A0AAV4LTI9_BABCB|nr:dihydroxy-acid dehydratase [Babesia caballi]
MAVKAHRNMAHGTGTESKVVGCAGIAAAEAIKVVSEEGLKRGEVIGSAAGGVIFLIVFALGSTTGAIMTAVNIIITAVVRFTDVRWDAFACSINAPPKSTLIPSTRFSVSIAALYVQKTKLKLQGVGIVGNRAKKSGA